MGIQDRDWYRDEMRARRAREERDAERETTKAQELPSRAELSRINRDSPPKLWGADWHWSLQLLVWLAIAALLLMIWRMVR